MKVLLAVDASSAGETVLNEMLGRTWPANTLFEVLNIIEPCHVSSDPEAVRGVVHRAEKLVNRAVDLLRSKGFETVGGTVVDNDPKLIIIDRARRIDSDLVVVGSRGRSAAHRFLLGSVAAAVLRHAPCSVEVVRAPLPRTDGSLSMRVLLATDGSECSALATSWIARCSWSSGSEVRIVSVPEVLLSARKALLELPFIISAVQSAREKGIQRTNEAIADAKSILRQVGLQVSECIYQLNDDPKTSILEEAAEWGAHLIVLGSQGRRSIDRFQLGSVSEAVAIHAPCSVAVIRNKGSQLR